MTTTPEPTDKLDATAALAVVNGPEDDGAGLAVRLTGAQAEREVRRLRQRIFTASKAGDLAKVRSLQKLMLRSRANASVERAAGDRAQCWPQDGRRRR